MEKLPKSWKDITIKQFIEISKITEKESVDNIDTKIKLLCVFTGRNDDYFLSLNYKEFNRLCNKLSFLNNLDISQRLIYNFKIGGTRYVVNPFINELQTAEYIDLHTFLKSKESINENLHKILAIFVKPKHKWFGLKKVYMKRGEIAEVLLNQMPITVAYPLCVFFCELLKNSIVTTKDYLDKQMKAVLKEAKKAGLHQSGGGTAP